MARDPIELGQKVAHWILSVISGTKGLEFELVDIATWYLPNDEPGIQALDEYVYEQATLNHFRHPLSRPQFCWVAIGNGSLKQDCSREWKRSLCELCSERYAPMHG
jgi:hypothetical protein